MSNLKDIKLKVIGRRDRLKNSIIKSIEELEYNSCNNKSLNLIIALDYGGREDIKSAIISLYNKYIRNKDDERVQF